MLWISRPVIWVVYFSVKGRIRLAKGKRESDLPMSGKMRAAFSQLVAQALKLQGLTTLCLIIVAFQLVCTTRCPQPRHQLCLPARSKAKKFPLLTKSWTTLVWFMS